MMLTDWRPSPRALITTGLALLVAMLGLGGGWFWYSAQQERANSVHAEALARAGAARGGQQPAAPNAGAAAMQTLETALAQAPGAGLAAQSAYELGGLRFDAGQYPAARAAYEIAIVKAASPTIRTLARAAIAAAWEAQQDYPKAIDAYTTALSGEGAGQFYFEDLLLGLGRAQELAGRRDEAIQTYKRVLKEIAKPRREPEVRGRLASLGAAG